MQHVRLDRARLKVDYGIGVPGDWLAKRLDLLPPDHEDQAVTCCRRAEVGDLADVGGERLASRLLIERVQGAYLHVEHPHEPCRLDRRARIVDARRPQRRERSVADAQRLQSVGARDEHDVGVVAEAAHDPSAHLLVVQVAADIAEVAGIEHIADAGLADLEHALVVEQRGAGGAEVAVGGVQVGQSVGANSSTTWRSALKRITALPSSNSSRPSLLPVVTRRLPSDATTAPGGAHRPLSVGPDRVLDLIDGAVG